MTGRCSYFMVTCQDAIGPAQVDAVGMIKSVLHASPAGERRILAILERDMDQGEFEAVAATIRVLSFVRDIEDTEPILETPDTGMRSQVRAAVADLEPSLSESGTVADFVRAYRQWAALRGEIEHVLGLPSDR